MFKNYIWISLFMGYKFFTYIYIYTSEIIEFIMNLRKKKEKEIWLTDSFFDRTTQPSTDPFLSLLHGISIKFNNCTKN